MKTRIEHVHVLVAVLALAIAFALPTEAARVSVRAAPGGAAPAPPSPSWKCRVCEDVVQTWHDRFKCAGSSLAMEPPNPFSPKAESTPFQSCRQPRLDCHDLNEHLKPVCIAMRYQLITRKEKHIWSTIMNRGNVYDTCIGLGKCINDTQQTDAKECRDSFKEPSCKDHVTCAPVQKKCSASCFLCYHLVRDWPLFQQTCKPEGAKIEAEAHLNEEKAQLKAGPKPAPSFLEQWTLRQNGKRMKHQNRDLQLSKQLQRRAQDMADRLAGPFGAPLVQKGRSDYFDEDLLALLEVDITAELKNRTAGNPYDSLDDEQAEQEAAYKRQRLERRRAVDARERERLHAMLVEVQQRQQQQQRQWQRQAEASAEAGAGAGADGPAAKIPVQNSDTLPLKCHEMWDSVRYSKKARYFVQWKEEVSILPSGQDRMSSQGLWDANVVCKCLGHCELSQFEYLGLEDVCRYGPPEQRTMDMALGAFIRDKPHAGVAPKDEEDEEGKDE